MKKLLFLFLLFSNNLLFSQCWNQVSNGQYHTIAIKNDGTLWTWGLNLSGQLGNGNNTNNNTPTQIGTSNDWRQVYAGGGHSMAIKNDGTLWLWGRNAEGQLGNNSIIDTNIPTQIGIDTDWKDIFGGIYVSAAIKNNGTLWAWGHNAANNQLGLPDNNFDILVPTQIGVDTDWKYISFGSTFTLGLKTNGTLFSWGQSNNGELGNGVAFSQVFTPTQVGIATDWKEISSGFTYSMAIKTNGTRWSWGLGHGVTPVQNGTATDWSTIRCYFNFNLAIKNNGTLWSWGNNSNGQLGQGNLTTLSSPTQIGIENNWTKISSGFRFSSILNSNSEVKTFGQNNYGQLGNASNTDSSTPIAVSCQSLGLESFNSDAFEIFPNPAKEHFYINKTINDEIKSVSIIDLFGKKIVTIVGDNSIIDINSLTSGLYIIKIETSNNVFNYKLIKE